MKNKQHPFRLSGFLRNRRIYMVYAMLIIMGMFVVSIDKFYYESEALKQQEEKLYKRMDRELVPEKPEFQYYIPEKTWLFDPATKDTIGHIRHSLLYANSESRDTLDKAYITGIIYCWIWAESIKENQLLHRENFRSRANTYPLGELYTGTPVHCIYINEKQSWILCSLVVSMTNESIHAHDEYMNKFRLIEPGLFISGTNQLDGIVFKYSHFLKFTDLPSWLQVVLHLIVFSVLSFIIIKIYITIYLKARLRSMMLWLGFFIAGMLTGLLLR